MLQSFLYQERGHQACAQASRRVEVVVDCGRIVQLMGEIEICVLGIALWSRLGSLTYLDHVLRDCKANQRVLPLRIRHRRRSDHQGLPWQLCEIWLS